MPFGQEYKKTELEKEEPVCPICRGAGWLYPWDAQTGKNVYDRVIACQCRLKKDADRHRGF